jgi:FMN reductase
VSHSLAVVVGNPKPASRTLDVARHVAHAAAVSIGLDPEDAITIDLATVAGELFDPDSSTTAELLGEVSAAPLLIVASPTYKGTYSGLLKVFLDRLPHRGLEGRVAVPVMVGATPSHSLAVDVHLRPLLVELGASVPSRGVYVTEGDLGGVADLAAECASHAGPLLGSSLGTLAPA